jgi:hypothetical protein
MYNTRIPAKEFIRRLRPAGATERLLQPSPKEEMASAGAGRSRKTLRTEEQ